MIPSQNPVRANPAVVKVRRQVVQPRVPLQSREHAERDAEHGCQCDRHQRQLQRGRKALDQVAEHGASGIETGTKVTEGQLFEIHAQLHVQGQIEAVTLPQGFDLLPGGALAGDQGDWISRHHPCQEECQDDQPDHGRNHGDQALSEIREKLHPCGS